MGIIGSIIIGCLAGFCAGKLMKGGGFGLIMNLVLGLLAAYSVAGCSHSWA